MICSFSFSPPPRESLLPSRLPPPGLQWCLPPPSLPGSPLFQTSPSIIKYFFVSKIFFFHIRELLIDGSSFKTFNKINFAIFLFFRAKKRKTHLLCRKAKREMVGRHREALAENPILLRHLWVGGKTGAAPSPLALRLNNWS